MNRIIIRHFKSLWLFFQHIFSRDDISNRRNVSEKKNTLKEKNYNQNHKAVILDVKGQWFKDSAGEIDYI